MDEKLLTKKPNKKTALINFDAETLKRLDFHAKRLKITRTRIVEFAVRDILNGFEAQK